MTTCYRRKRENASDTDEIVRKQCCRMASPTHSTAHRGGHMVCLMSSAECGYQELAGCLDHFSYRLGSGGARHALVTTSLPSSSQCCRLAQQPRYLNLWHLPGGSSWPMAPSQMPSRLMMPSQCPQQMHPHCPCGCLTAPSQHKARHCPLVRAECVALRAPQPHPFHAMFCTR